VAEALPEFLWVHPLVVVRDSGIEGRGLFAVGGFPVGEVVLRLSGRLVSTAELGRLIADANADPSRAYVDTLTVYEDVHLVLPPGTAIHFGNHSCNPTMWHVGPYEIATRRAIEVGEELTIDYGTQSGAAGFSMMCRCGSPMCRGVVTSDDWLLPALQARYRDHWVPALEARIARERGPGRSHAVSEGRRSPPR
jgi:hypothetical protein